MDFIRWQVVIYCLAIGSYFVSLSGWWAPATNMPFIQTWTNASTSSTQAGLLPISYVFGWEIVKAVIMIGLLAVLAPVYLTAFFLSIPGMPLAIVPFIVAPLYIIFYYGFAQFIMRMRSPEGV